LSFHRPTKFEVLTAVLLKIQTFWNVAVSMSLGEQFLVLKGL